MDTNDSARFQSKFSPAYAAKVDMACALSPKFEREIVVAKLENEPKLAQDGPPHQDMNKRFEVMGQSPGGHSFMSKATGVPRGAHAVKLRGPEEAKAPAPPVTAMKSSELEEVIVIPGNASSEVPDEKVIERIERMMRAEQRARDLEEENRVLTRMIMRLQAEIDALKAK